MNNQIIVEELYQVKQLVEGLKYLNFGMRPILRKIKVPKIDERKDKFGEMMQLSQLLQMFMDTIKKASENLKKQNMRISYSNSPVAIKQIVNLGEITSTGDVRIKLKSNMR